MSSSKRKTIKRHQNIAKNIRFTTTTDKERVFWIEMVYPFGAQFLQIVKEIPWKDYIFEGKTDILIEESNENESNEKKTQKVNVDLGMGNESYRKETSEGKAELQSIPYVLFGGVGCELYNRKYKTNILLEPTADIDCRLALPFFSDFVHDEITPYMYDDEKDTYTPLIKHYTEWLVDALADCLEKYTTLIEEFPFSKAEKENNHETAKADMSRNVGNFLITRIYQPDNLGIPTIKIQVSVAVGEISFHVLEFILTQSSKNFRTENIEGYNVMTVQQLFLSQIKTLSDKKKGTKYCKRIKMLGTVMNKKKIKGVSKKLLDTIQCEKNVKNVTNLLG